MCGIAGIIANSNINVDREQHAISQMTASLHHRGPDATHYSQADCAMFGHTRLAIIDPEHGTQPMRSADGRYHFIYNGELYNYRALRHELALRGVTVSTESDTEVMFAALLEYGADALAKFNGMFAFVLYDSVTQEWLAARDPFGIKPLYYTQTDKVIVFASEIKALLKYPSVRAQLSHESLQQYLMLQFCLNDNTLFDNIHKIEPGYFIRGRGREIVKKVCYWDTDYSQIGEQSLEEYAEELNELISDSVKLQLRSDVSVGTYLSGGLDSSIVTTHASHHLTEPVKCFHGRFNEPGFNETEYASLVSEFNHAQLFQTTCTAQQFVEDLPKIIYHMDEPLAGPGVFPQYRVSHMAKQEATVVLGGQGGDEIFGGYTRFLVAYLEQALKGAIFETQEEEQHVVTFSSIIPNLPALQKYKPLMQKFWSTGLFEPMDQRYFHLINRSEQLSTLLSDDYAAFINTAVVFEQFQKVFNHPSTKSYFNKMTHFDIKTLLPALLHVEDRVSMAVSLESRVPLLDTRIVELMNKVPPKLKFNGGDLKHILKYSQSNKLPKSIINRQDKMGFPVPLNLWLKNKEINDFVSDILLSSKSIARGIFKPQALQAVIDSPDVLGRQLWGLLCLELWFDTFVDDAT